MKILICNWRDPKNPKAGGAERITQRYAEYWTSKGHTVLWVTNTYQDSSKVEVMNNVHYFRVGPILSGSIFQMVYLYPLFLIKSILLIKRLVKDKKIDVIIDEIHGLPYFTPWYCSTKVVLLTCEFAGVIWDKMYPWPINVVGRLMEKNVYQGYRKAEIWAISKSTKQDIERILPKHEIKVLPLGVDTTYQISECKKNTFPSAIFVARLVKMKGVEIAIAAAELVSKQDPQFQLFIVGGGEVGYIDYLKEKVEKLGIKQNVQFLGKVAEKDKMNYLAKSHFLWHPSFKEGFGLTVLEAGLVKTPAIVKSGSSLTELVTDGQDGFIIDTPQQLAETFLKYWNAVAYKDIANNAQKKSSFYSWDKILKQSEQVTGMN